VRWPAGLVLQRRSLHAVFVKGFCIVSAAAAAVVLVVVLQGCCVEAWCVSVPAADHSSRVWLPWQLWRHHAIQGEKEGVVCVGAGGEGAPELEEGEWLEWGVGGRGWGRGVGVGGGGGGGVWGWGWGWGVGAEGGGWGGRGHAYSICGV
jgi:hypothetical protein